MGSRLLPKRLPNFLAPLATPRRTPLSRQKKTAILSWSPTLVVRRTIASAWSVGMVQALKSVRRRSPRRGAGRADLEEILGVVGIDPDVRQDLAGTAERSRRLAVQEEREAS